MKKSILIILIVISFFFLYLEWGDQQRTFVWQTLGDIFSGGQRNFSHPLIIFPFIGILGLVYCSIKTNHASKILWISIALMSPLVLLILLAAILSWNIKMLIGPIIIILLVCLLYFEKRKQPNT